MHDRGVRDPEVAGRDRAQAEARREAAGLILEALRAEGARTSAIARRPAA